MKSPALIVSLSTIFVVLIGTAGLVSRGAEPGAAGDPVKGKAIFTREKCNVCHRVNGSGGVLAPDLSAVGARRSAAWLAKFLPNPTVLDPKNPPKVKMTPPNVKGQDLDDLIAYLLTLKGK